MRVPVSLVSLCVAAAVAASGEPRTWGETEFRGRTLRYEARDGLAIHGGDMVLGRVEEIEARDARRRGKGDRGKLPLRPRSISAVEPDYLWPDGVIPYEIDPRLTDVQREGIPEAIAAWNEQTVISLVPRDGEEDYVRFEPRAAGPCAATAGRRGGRQGVFIPDGGCDKYSVIHELGHAVGLWHEHQRVDRHEYLMVFEDRVGVGWRGVYSPVHPGGGGAYDYASIMHYSLFTDAEVVMETIPPGINDGREYGLSAGDIDGVARLYGQPPTATTLSTYPPGLDLIVDGARVSTPAVFDWPEGGEHVVEAPLAQVRDGEARYLFGRWNVDGGRHLAVTAGERTWIEANYVIQPKITPAVWPPGSGSVALEPPSPDGYRLIRSTVTATPRAADRYRFWRWADWVGYVGDSSDPASVVLGWARGLTFKAEFTTGPLFRIESRIDPLYLEVGGQLQTAPLSLPTPPPGEVGEVAVSVMDGMPGGAGIVRFARWSDGNGDAERTLEVPHEGGAIEVLTSEWVRLDVGLTPGGWGDVIANPPSEDGYYELGTKVRLSPVPIPNRAFQRWEGDIQSDDPALEVEMDRDVGLELHFEHTQWGQTLTPGVRQQIDWRAGWGDVMFYEDDDGFVVRPPRGSARLEIAFDCAAPGAEVDLYVNAGRAWPHILAWISPDRRSWGLNADFRSENPGCAESVVIDETTDPPLDPGGVYGVAFVSRKTGMRIRGGVLATVEMAPKAPVPAATPRAFTFVAAGADPAPQSFALSNDGDADLLWSAASDAAWLSAAPASGSLAPGESVEVSVSAAAGGLPSEAHAGRLAIRHDGIEDLVLPVHFVVLPPELADPR